MGLECAVAMIPVEVSDKFHHKTKTVVVLLTERHVSHKNLLNELGCFSSSL